MADEPCLDRVVIISLARRQAKRASMLERAAVAGIDHACTVFDAIDGSAISDEWLREHGYEPYARWRIEGHPSRFYSRELLWGELGCTISHLQVWEECVLRADAGEHRPTLVLEDDMVFPELFAPKLARVLAAADAAPATHGVSAPDLVYLFSKPFGDIARGSKSVEAPIDDERQLVFNPPPSRKTGAYLIWPAGARKLVASALRTNLVPSDDFLPAVAAGHPLRPELNALFRMPLAPPLAAEQGEQAAQHEQSARGFVAYAVGPSLFAERRFTMSDTENSAEVDCQSRTRSDT
jgi:GR25 family glycosyltransferase involved in LPS biosynthesis